MMMPQLPSQWPSDVDASRLRHVGKASTEHGEADVFLMPEYAGSEFYVTGAITEATRQMSEYSGAVFVWFEPDGGRRFDIGVANFRSPH